MIHVIKRDGKVTEFQLSKITGAITKAFKATGTDYNNEILELLALRVTADFQGKMKDQGITVEQIQDSVERVLEQTGYEKVAKAYILYRRQREKIRNMNNTILDYRDVVNRYMADAGAKSRREDAPVYSVGGLILSNSGAVTENYWLTEIYDTEVADAHRAGLIEIRDLDMLSGCTCRWSLQKLIREGLSGVEGMITCAPAKHLAALCNQMVNFLGIMQNEWAGAQTFASFDTCLAPFVKADGMGYPDVKSCVESFIYGINIPSRWGTQAPCVHIGLDGTVPEKFRSLPAVIGGREIGFSYGDCQGEMDQICRAVREVLDAKDGAGRPFAYPVVERQIQDTAGSIGTVAVTCKPEADFDRVLELAVRALRTKRRVLTVLLEGGLYPYTKRYLGTLEHHSSIIELKDLAMVPDELAEARTTAARECLRRCGLEDGVKYELKIGLKKIEKNCRKSIDN